VMMEENEVEPKTSPGWLVFLAWCIRHWFLVLILVGALIYALVPKESDHPRSGYTPSGRQVTEQECINEGGQIVGDVCYAP
jgi:hypothetical protein